MQSLKWFFIAVFVAREMLKIQWDRMLEKIVTCFRKHLAFLEERFFVGCTQHASGNGRCQMETKRSLRRNMTENYQITSCTLRKMCKIVGNWVWHMKFEFVSWIIDFDWMGSYAWFSTDAFKFFNRRYFHFLLKNQFSNHLPINAYNLSHHKFSVVRKFTTVPMHNFPPKTIIKP